MSFRHSRRAASLPDLIACILVLGLVAALLIPAVYRARLAADRHDTTDHLRKVGMAAHRELTEESPSARAARRQAMPTNPRGTAAQGGQEEEPPGVVPPP